MTEIEAQQWILAQFGPEPISVLKRFETMLTAENARHNLIAPSTEGHIWARHFVDSAQLLSHAPATWRHWIDIGSGAGFPGLVIAILTTKTVTLIEPRRLRADFLRSCCAALSLDDAHVVQAKAESVTLESGGDVISARAVAKLDAVFTMSQHVASSATTYILPKGVTAQTEVANARSSWQGKFHVKHSIVDPNSGIIVATGVARR